LTGKAGEEASIFKPCQSGRKDRTKPLAGMANGHGPPTTLEKNENGRSINTIHKKNDIKIF